MKPPSIIKALLKKEGTRTVPTLRLWACPWVRSRRCSAKRIHPPTPCSSTCPLGYTLAVVPVGSRLADDAYIVTPSTEPDAPAYDLDDPDLLIG